MMARFEWLVCKLFVFGGREFLALCTTKSFLIIKGVVCTRSEGAGQHIFVISQHQPQALMAVMGFAVVSKPRRAVVGWLGSQKRI
jgi:hypothetical protein